MASISLSEHSLASTTSLFVLMPRSAFPTGRRDVRIKITDADDFTGEFPFNLMGPVTPAPATGR